MPLEGAKVREVEDFFSCTGRGGSVDKRSICGAAEVRGVYWCVTVCWVALKILKWIFPTLFVLVAICEKIMGLQAISFHEVSILSLECELN